MTKKLAIVVGHNHRAQGAVRITDGVSEFVWNSKLASMIAAHAPDQIKVFFRQHGAGYSREVDKVYAQLDAWGANASVELHFNGIGNPKVHGGMTLSSGTSGSMELAQHIQSHSVAALGVRDLGIKVRGRKDRGGRSLHAGKAPAIMTEPFFGSNADDCRRADRHMDELAEAIVRGAWAFFDLDIEDLAA